MTIAKWGLRGAALLTMAGLLFMPAKAQEQADTVTSLVKDGFEIKGFVMDTNGPPKILLQKREQIFICTVYLGGKSSCQHVD